MSNKEIKIILDIKSGDLSSSYDFLIGNCNFLRGLYNKLHMYGYSFDEFINISYLALLNAAKSADLSKLEYFNGYWKQYILHEYIQEKLKLQYKFSVSIYEYQKAKRADSDLIETYKEKVVAEYVMGQNCFDHLIDVELNKLLWERVKALLSEQNAYILFELYHSERSMASLAREMGIGAERIRQRKLRSLKKLESDEEIRLLAQDFFGFNV